MYLEVSLPLPITRHFYYRLPEAPSKPMQPGQRVLVPLGNRKVTGYVLKAHPRLPSDFPQTVELKPVLEVLDDSSLISPGLFELSRWVADYYFASLGEVLKACLPPGINPRMEQRFSLTASGERLLKQTKNSAEISQRKRQILELLARHSGLDRRALERLAKHRVTAAELEALAAASWIRIEQAPRGTVVAAKKRWFLSLHPDWKEALPEARLTDNQRALISHLRSAGGAVSLAGLRKLFSVSRPALERLEQRQLVRLSRDEVARDPLGGTDPAGRYQPRVPSQQQRKALEALIPKLNAGRFSAVLLHGVTGSGKTEVYLGLIEHTLRSGKTALALMPEIALTPAVAEEFRARLGNTVAILHSGLSDGERHDEWWRIKRGHARVVIGTRSAVFAPLENPGLVVVDEEHDPSYKQQESPRYHGRDTAIVRGKQAGAVVVLGSATPSIETFHHSREGKYGYLRMAARIHSRPLPETRLVDMRADFETTSRITPLSAELSAAIGDRLERQEQILVLLNRRGYAAHVLCRSCGENIQCRFCSIAMTYHKIRKALVCHYCGYRQRVPQKCPACHSKHLYFMGEGTEKVEGLLKEAFPEARVDRLDRDAARRKDAHRQILSRFRQRKTDILTGTQMISKGHDFPFVTLVGVVSADHSLSFPDFRAAERTFQLLSQVSGRAGRGELPGEVLIQSYCPEHYCFRFVTSHDYEGFYEKEIQFRRFMHYPPFTALALILVRDKNLAAATETINRFAELLQGARGPQTRILGPTQSPLPRIRSEHRFQLLIKSRSRSRLQALLRKTLHQAQTSGLDLRRIHIDIDPIDLM
ncbi:MAG: primosomal protein N' [Acidobacteriota bacterium]|nr:primosomal protein N' [Acidobacteriota bacterium]